MNYRKEYRRLFSLTPNEMRAEFSSDEEFYKKLNDYMHFAYQELLEEQNGCYELSEPMERR